MRPLTKLALGRCRGLRRRTEGTAAVEFAILAMVFLMIIGGVMDFGHAYYIKQVVTNASREGARYGVTFNIYNTAMRMPPNAFSPTIQSYVQTKYLTGTGVTATVTPSGTGYTSGVGGDPLTVTVTATKTWWLLGPILGSSSTTISATTTMRLEG